MRRRYELSSRQWKRLLPLLPHPRHHGGRGHPWLPHGPVLHGILWVLHTGAPWRDVPERYGPWQTIYDRFNKWRTDGTWATILTELLDHLDQHGQISRDLWCMDGSVIRASRAAAGATKTATTPRRLGGPKATQLEEPADHALGRSQGGFGTKVHLLCDSNGIPIGIFVTPGQRHESKFFEATLQRLMLPRRRGRKYWPKRLAADKGYSYAHIRQWLKRHHIQPVIPTRKNQIREKNFDKANYRRRNIIERAIGWFKECRRLGTRFEKLAVNYLGFWMVAMIEKLLCHK